MSQERDIFEGAQKKRDWQVTTILAGELFIETDCNSGEQRRIRKSKCTCGQDVLIEYNTTGFRKDGKRIFYADKDEAGYHAFRCRSCSQPVHESVPYADFEENNGYLHSRVGN